MNSLTVIIPASNEQDYIGDCLNSVLTQKTTAEIQAIVVANGCHDATAHAAGRHKPAFATRGWQLQVEELTAGGKIGALNHGDACAIHDCRLYLDADIRMDPAMIQALMQVLDTAEPRLAGGRLVVAPAASAVSRAYGRFWSRLPFMTENLTAAGLFAVNAAGRARWQQFPQVISDDTFVRLNFAETERQRVNVDYRWPLAEGFQRLVRVRRRQDRGVAEIAERFPDLMANQGHSRPDRQQLLRLAASDPIGFSCYSAVALAVRLGRNATQWERGR